MSATASNNRDHEGNTHLLQKNFTARSKSLFSMTIPTMMQSSNCPCFVPSWTGLSVTSTLTSTSSPLASKSSFLTCARRSVYRRMHTSRCANVSVTTFMMDSASNEDEVLNAPTASAPAPASSSSTPGAPTPPTPPTPPTTAAAQTSTNTGDEPREKIEPDENPTYFFSDTESLVEPIYVDQVPGKIVLDEIQYAKQKKALEEYAELLRKDRLKTERENARLFGWVKYAETMNGRFAMFFFVTGLLTEYWTEYTIPEQIELLLRTLGVI